MNIVGFQEFRTTKDSIKEINNNINFTKLNKPYKLIVLKFGFIPYITKLEKKNLSQLKVISKAPRIRVIFQEINNKKNDAIFTVNIHSIETLLFCLIGKIKKKKIIIGVKDWVFKKDSIYSRISNITVKYIVAKQGDYFISYSENAKNFLEKDLNVPNSKIYNAYSPKKNHLNIKIDKHKQKEIKDNYFSKKKVNFLFVGRFIPFKGVDIFLKAAKQFKDQINIIAIGNDETNYGKYCKKIANKYNINILFLGHIPKDDVKYFYLNADVFVLPNKYCPKNFEPVEMTGNVLYETMAFGTPAIVTTATGSGEDFIKDDDTGMIVKGNSVETLKNAIEDVLNNPKQWEKRKKKTRESYQNMLKQNEKELKRLFEDLVKEKNHL
ncbi:MAG: glycosyltransferase family 4 protein [Candidatus Nanoarchaeia archaeon]